MAEDRPAWYELKMTKDLKGVMGGKAIRGVLCNYFSSRIYTGKVGLLQTAKYLEAALPPGERRALIIADSFTARYAARVTEHLDLIGMEHRVWPAVEPEVPLGTVDAGAAVCEEFRPTAIFALGGGSAMDTAKMIMVRYERPELDLRMIFPFTSLGLRKKARFFIAIPTTSGTGSEVTPVAVATDTARTPHKKLEVFCDEFFADMTVLDPDFVKDMPPFLTMATGLDALSHAIGSHVSNWGTPYIDAMNLTAVREIVKYLPRSIEYGAGDLEARAHMQMASLMAGIGFGNTTAGIDHSMGHSLGTIFKVHHGLAVTAFLATSIGFQARITDRWMDLCPLFGVSTEGDRTACLERLHAALAGFIRSAGGAASVSELVNPRIDRGDYVSRIGLLADYAENDAVNLTSYRPAELHHYRKLFEYAWDGRQVDF